MQKLLMKINQSLELTPLEKSKGCTLIHLDDDGPTKYRAIARDSINGTDTGTIIKPSKSRDTYTLAIDLQITKGLGSKFTELCEGHIITAYIPFIPLDKTLSSDYLSRYGGYLFNNLSDLIIEEVGVNPGKFGFILNSETEQYSIPAPYPFGNEVEVMMGPNKNFSYEIISVNGENKH